MHLADRVVVDLGLGVLSVAGPVVGGRSHHDTVEVDLVGIEQHVDESADVVTLEVGGYDGARPYALFLLELGGCCLGYGAILRLVAFMQLYRGVCAPLYDREGAMEQTRYAFLDLATAVGLYACLVGMAGLFKRYKVSSSALLDRRTRIIMLYILVSLLVSMLLPEVVSGVDSSQLVIALVLSDFPLIYYIFGRFTQNLEEQTRMEQALEKARAEWMVYEKSRELRETIREERHHRRR